MENRGNRSRIPAFLVFLNRGNRLRIPAFSVFLKDLPVKHYTKTKIVGDRSHGFESTEEEFSE